MYYVNKIALAIFNPITFGVILFLIMLSFVFMASSLLKRNSTAIKSGKKMRMAWVVALSCILWFYFWSVGLSQRVMGALWGLDEYRLTEIDTLPNCDVIVELGGGMGGNPSISQYACLTPAASRPWHAARLWKAGKAPFVMTSGSGTLDTDGQLLQDLGIPLSALIFDNESRNTEENAIFVQKMVCDRLGVTNARILLVTSASHMKRAMMIFRKCAPRLTCVPVVTDYGSVNWFAPFSYRLFLPSVATLASNLTVWKECLGIIGYRIRGF